MMALSLPGGIFAPDDSRKPARNGPGKAVLQPPSHRFRIVFPLLGLRTHDFLPAWEIPGIFAPLPISSSTRREDLLPILRKSILASADSEKSFLLPPLSPGLQSRPLWPLRRGSSFFVPVWLKRRMMTSPAQPAFSCSSKSPGSKIPVIKVNGHYPAQIQSERSYLLQPTFRTQAN